VRSKHGVHHAPRLANKHPESDRIDRGRGWEIAKQCWKIVLKDKSLIPFPLLSALSTLLLLASFIAPV
jgi:hypothetical protein